MQIVRQFAYEFELDQSERNSSQVIASTRKSWKNGSHKTVQVSNSRLLTAPVGRVLEIFVFEGDKVKKRRKASTEAMYPSQRADQ